MAFGGLRGTLTGFGTSIVTPGTATGSVAVSIQDLVVVMVAEAAANTANVVTDNLGQTYTAINAGTLSVVGLRGYYRYVTVAGTLTQVSCTMTSSSNDYAISVAVYEGPFTSTPLDRAPTNTIDAATPYTCAATTVLSQANELIVAGLGLHRCQSATATSPLILAINTLSAAANTNNAVSSTIGQQLVATTTSVTPVFASSGTITGGVQIVATFRQGVIDTTRGTVSTTSTASSTGRYDISRVGTAAAVTTGTTSAGSSDIAGAGSASATATATATGLVVTYPLGLIAQSNKAFPTADGGTTDPIDTSGANMLFLHFSHDVAVNFFTVSDNKGNNWLINTPISDAASGAVCRERTYNAALSGIKVGTGHTVTVTGTGGKIAIQFSAWRSSTGPGFDQLGVGQGALPHGGGPITQYFPDELIITSFSGASSPAGVEAGTTILNTIGPGTNNYATSVAYFIRHSAGTLEPWWFGSGNAGVTTQGYIGTWLDANASVGTASATSSAVGVAPAVATDTGTGTASALGAASGVGLATIDTGVGTASAHATATGRSPSTGPVGLIAHVEQYGPELGGTSGAIDTTGANLLVLSVTGYGGIPGFTDSKGNTWAQLGSIPTGGPNYSAVYYVNSQTPNVGTGHTITFGAQFGSVQFLAFKSNTPWAFDAIQQSTPILPNAGPSLTSVSAGELVITPAGGRDHDVYFTGVGDEFDIYVNQRHGAYNNSATAWAWKIQRTTGSAQATWTGNPGYLATIHILAFTGDWGGALTNFASAANGGTAAASTEYSAGYPASAAINGSRDSSAGGGWGSGNGGWNDSTNGVFPDTLDVTFNAVYPVQKIEVVTLKDDYWATSTPALNDVSTQYGISNFLVQYWDGSVYQTIATVTSTNKIRSQFVFAPISTNKIRISVNDSIDHQSSRLVEVEAWGLLPPVADTGVGTATAVATATGISPAGTDISGAGTAVATGLANATGRYDIARVGSATATSTVNATGRSDSPVQGIATATSTVNATGRSDTTANINSSTATSTANATSRYDIARTGSSTSTSTANATSSSDSSRTGSSTATSTASATGYGDAPRTGSSTATSTANATSRYDISRAGTSTATSVASAQLTADKNLSTTRYSDPDVFGNPIVEHVGGAFQYVTPNLYVDPDTFKVHTLSVGSVTLNQTRYVDPDTFKAHTVSRGAVTLIETRYVDPDTFKAHTVGRGAVTLAETRYVDPDTFKAHTVSRGQVNLLSIRYADPDIFKTGSVVSGIVRLVQTQYVDPDTFKAHTVNRGPVSLLQARYADPDLFGAATLTLGPAPQILTPARYADPDTFKAHTVGRGPVRLTQTRYIDPDTFKAHTVSRGAANLIQTRYIDPDAFGTGSIIGRGSVGLLQTLYINPDSFYTHNVVVRVSLRPTRHVGSNTFGNPHLGLTVTLHPSLFVNESYFGDIFVGSTRPISILGSQYAVHIGA